MTSKKFSMGILFVAVLWLIQSFGRIYFAAAGTPDGMGKFLDAPVSYITSLMLFTMFLLLGILGLVAALGLLARRKWGFWTAIIASVATIIFDIWGITIQYTAAIGFIVPAISILYLYPKKSQLPAAMD